MTGRLLTAAFAATFFVISANVVICQEKKSDKSDKNSKTPAVFVDAVKGECQFDQQPFLPNGRAIDISAQRTVSGEAVSIYQPKILTRLVPDYPVKISIEEEFRKTGKYRTVSSPAQANFVFHVCSSYWEDWAPRKIVEASSLPPTYRMSAHVYAMSAASYRRSVDNYVGLNNVALWGQDIVCCQQGDKKTDKKTSKKTKAKKKNNKEVITTVSSMGTRVVPTGEASTQDLAKSFLKFAPKLAPNIMSPVITLPGSDFPLRRRRPSLSAEKVVDRMNAPNQVNPSIGTYSEPGEVDTLKIDTTLVTLPVSVMDRDGKYVPRLTRENFKLFEDGVEQQITDFGRTELPFHVTLVLDISGSTSFRIEDIQQAATAFINQLRPQDEVMVVSFDKYVTVNSEFTSNRGKLLRAVQGLENGVSTRVHDALDLVLTERFARIQGRKAIVLFSDGVDTASKLSDIRKVVEHVEESDTLVYSIRYDTWADLQKLGSQNDPDEEDPANPKPPGSKKEDFEVAASQLKQLSAISGGRYYDVESIKDINKAFAYIAEELRRQYWLGYYPTNTTNDGSYRRIRVTVNQPGLVIRTREGYRVAENPDTHQTANSEQESPGATVKNNKPF